MPTLFAWVLPEEPETNACAQVADLGSGPREQERETGKERNQYKMHC